jgi:hypothetical protein
VAKREDEGIAEGQWEALNRAFYARERGPHEYIRARLTILRDTGDIDLRTVESVNLLHHAAEALIRQYLAHRGAPVCPWLELSRHRDFTAFRAAESELRATLSAGDRPDDLVPVFCGPPHGRTPAATAAIARAGDGLSALLQYGSDVLLDEAGMYNAIKHGIAAVPGVRPLPEEVEGRRLPKQRGGGMSLLTLQPRDSDDGRRWTRVITYVNAEENLAMTELISDQLENLWHVARSRYLGVPLARLHPVTEEMAHRARHSAGVDAPATVHEVGFSLLYREDERAVADAPRPDAQ